MIGRGRSIATRRGTRRSGIFVACCSRCRGCCHGRQDLSGIGPRLEGSAPQGLGSRFDLAHTLFGHFGNGFLTHHGSSGHATRRTLVGVMTTTTGNESGKGG